MRVTLDSAAFCRLDDGALKPLNALTSKQTFQNENCQHSATASDYYPHHQLSGLTVLITRRR
jgi:hypothetical protein